MKQFFSIVDINYEMGTNEVSSLEISKNFITQENPENKVNHFVKDVLGKEKLYRFSKDDDLISTITRVVENLLLCNNVKPEDIDAVICTSVVPEYYMPIFSMVLHKQLKLRPNVKIAMDINANCIGMISSLYTINGIMGMDDTVNNVLLIDLMTLSHYVPLDDIVGNVCLSDAAMAILLKRRDEPVEGFHFQSYQDSDQAYRLVGPSIGTLHMFEEGSVADYRLKCNQVLDCKMEEMAPHAKEILSMQNLPPTDIKKCYCSQYVKANIEILRDGVGFAEEQVPYIGDKLGYTGPSSPLIVLSNSLTNGEVRRGDKIMFWSVATGLQHVFMTITY